MGHHVPESAEPLGGDRLLRGNRNVQFLSSLARTILVVRFLTPRSIAGPLSFALTGLFRNSLRTPCFQLLPYSIVALDQPCGSASTPMTEWRPLLLDSPAANPPAVPKGPAARHRRAVFFSDRRPFPRRWLGCVAHAVIRLGRRGGHVDSSHAKHSLNRILAEFGPFSAPVRQIRRTGRS